MFSQLSNFLDKNPYSYLFICCLAFVVWAKLLYVRLFNYSNGRTLGWSKMPIFANHTGIQWIESNRLPTNIETNLAEKYLLEAPLMWHGFEHQPIGMLFENTGSDVRMTAEYQPGKVPFVCGAELDGNYLFKAVRFLCSQQQQQQQRKQQQQQQKQQQRQYIGNGVPQHIVNGRHYDLEMQLLVEHITAERNVKTLIISYFFIEDKQKNYCLDPLLKCLKYVRRPSTSKTFSKSFPLDRIVYKCQSGFYAYTRTLHRANDVRHFVEVNAVISIGIEQMNEFQKLARSESHPGIENGSDEMENKSNDVQLFHYLGRRMSPKCVKIEQME